MPRPKPLRPSDHAYALALRKQVRAWGRQSIGTEMRISQATLASIKRAAAQCSAFSEGLMPDRQDAIHTARYESEELQAALSDMVKENIGLISTVGQHLRNKTEAVLREGLEAGWTQREIAQKIEARVGISASHADFIARDQIGKMNGQLVMLRAKELGSTRYRWVCTHDQRTRKRHRDLDKSIQEWDSPPIVDLESGRREHPGGDFNCRCNAVPIFDDEEVVVAPKPKPKPAPKPRTPPKPEIFKIAPAVAQRERSAVTELVHKRLPGLSASRSGNTVFLANPQTDQELDAAGAEGSRGWDGTIHVKQDTMRVIGLPPARVWTAKDEGAYKSAKQVKYETQELRDHNKVWGESMGVVVHEELHSHGPMGTDPSKYRGGHAVIEEVTTEALSRRLTRPVFERERGPYQRHIDSVLETLQKHAPGATYETLIKISEKYKATPYNESRSLVGVFVDEAQKLDPMMDGLQLANDLLGLKL